MKTLIFDFDGTLVDSMKQWAGSILKILDENGISYPSSILKILTPLGYIGSAKYLRERYGLQHTVDEMVAQMNANALEAYRYHILAKEGVADTLKRLKQQGYSLNVLTASPHTTLDICLKRNGIYDLFDNIWSCDDFFTTKSDVNIYHTVAEKLGTVTTECIFFDDNLLALQTAKKSGMTVIGVYDESSVEYTEEIKAISHRYISLLSEF